MIYRTRFDQRALEPVEGIHALTAHHGFVHMYHDNWLPAHRWRSFVARADLTMDELHPVLCKASAQFQSLVSFSMPHQERFVGCIYPPKCCTRGRLFDVNVEQFNIDSATSAGSIVMLAIIYSEHSSPCNQDRAPGEVLTP